ncbi:MAG: SRPBCC family protein [Lewinella sp.]|nr:SRPBCC family protein [Lewinella sp.]
MNIQVQVPINASKADIWAAITNIRGAVDRVSGIEQVEILEEPADGLIGLKWRETRTLFGKTATEIMWITEAEPEAYYLTRAESHGAIYISEMAIVEEGGQNFLRMAFQGEGQTFMAKLMSTLMGPLVKGATRKAMEQDLLDIKQSLES